MPVKKKVSVDAPIVDNSKNQVNTSEKKQPTPQEVKDWYNENKSKLNFDKANDALKNLRDVSKTAAMRTVSTFDKSSLRTYLQNISSNEKNLRNLSRYLYYRSQVYYRLIAYYKSTDDKWQRKGISYISVYIVG